MPYRAPRSKSKKKKKILDSTYDNSKQMKLTSSFYDGCLKPESKEKRKLDQNLMTQEDLNMKQRSAECPNCDFVCGYDHIHEGYKFKCPECGTVFEPEDEEIE